jgi:hypothetical protein
MSGNSSSTHSYLSFGIFVIVDVLGTCNCAGGAAAVVGVDEMSGGGEGGKWLG